MAEDQRGLLDTQAFIWFVTGNPSLSRSAHSFITDPSTEVLFSVVSAWEIVIKEALGKLSLGVPAEQLIADQISREVLTVLTVTLPHVLRVRGLGGHHRDPFDRLLVAQALEEDVLLITNDPLLAPYGARTLW